jgi:acetyl esterase/lipase
MRITTLLIAVTILTTAAYSTPAAAADPATQPATTASTRPIIRLWDGDAPGALGSAATDIPTLTVFQPAPDKATGAALIICPGGAYGHLSDREGPPVAEWANTVGITAYVLKYRLGPRYHHPIEMGDARRALRLVRSHAADWHLDANRIGILGFSAGGHLASTTATHFDNGQADAADPIDRVSCRPDLAILMYPVITMTDPFVHKGSRTALLGDNPDPQLIDLLSNEKQVTAQTPPCLIFHGYDDRTVPIENTLMFVEACRKAGVSVEVHILEHGTHGFAMGGKDPVLTTWPATAARWLKNHKFAD